MARQTKKVTKDIRPDFSMKMSDGMVDFGVTMTNNVLEISGTNWSEITSVEDLSKLSSLISDITGRLEMEVLTRGESTQCDCCCNETVDVAPALTCC